MTHVPAGAPRLLVLRCPSPQLAVRSVNRNEGRQRPGALKLQTTNHRLDHQVRKQALRLCARRACIGICWYHPAHPLNRFVRQETLRARIDRIPVIGIDNDLLPSMVEKGLAAGLATGHTPPEQGNFCFRRGTGIPTASGATRAGKDISRVLPMLPRPSVYSYGQTCRTAASHAMMVPAMAGFSV
jgi:hypothetical protein